MRTRGERLLPWIAAERTLRGLLLIAAGIYLVAHTGSNFGSLANRLARAIELDPRRHSMIQMDQVAAQRVHEAAPDRRHNEDQKPNTKWNTQSGSSVASIGS